jgi:hypothetical protein
MKRLSGAYRVHYHQPLRRGVAAVVLVILTGFGGWSLYQWGHAVGGDGQSSARDTVRELQRQVSTLERANRQLVQRNAQLERDQVIARESVRRVQDALQQMEARFRVMEEELAFYRSIVSPENAESGLQIHSLTLEPVGRDGEYLYKAVLTQVRGSGMVEGTLELALVGQQGPARVELGSAELGEDLQASQPFGFRYFQNLEGRIRVPAGVTPRSLRVTARTGGDRPRQVEQDYAWDTALERGG